MSSSPESPERLLGIDPGTRVTGWGLLGGPAHSPLLIDCGTLSLGGAAVPLAERLARLRDQLEAVVRQHEPTAAAVEAPYQGVNPRSALQLAHARGVVLAVLAGAGLQVAEYSPAAVKKTVTGNGRAPKDQVRWMVSRLLGGRRLTGGSDLSDALAVALCHAAHSRLTAATATRVRGRSVGPTRPAGRVEPG